MSREPMYLVMGGAAPGCIPQDIELYHSWLTASNRVKERSKGGPLVSLTKLERKGGVLLKMRNKEGARGVIWVMALHPSDAPRAVGGGPS